MENINLNNNVEAREKKELLAAWMTSFACALACMAALPMGLRAGGELDLTPMQLAFVVAGGWLLGIAGGGYASLFWKRVHTPRGRVVMLVAAAWAAGGLCSVSDGTVYLLLLGLLAMISAAIFASQLRPRATTPAALASGVWAIAGATAGLLLTPPAFHSLVAQMGTFGAWRVVLMAPPALLVAAAVAGYQLTRPPVERLEARESIELPVLPAHMIAAA